MNSTEDSSSDTGGFAYGIGVTLVVLVAVIIITLVSYFCTRLNHQATSNTGTLHRTSYLTDQQSISIELGLDEATLRSYPKLLFSQAKIHKGDSVASSCSICLGDYKDTDMLRLLPDCGHLFHLKCVDSWLRMNPTCPICRNSPVPTPLTTPLAEVTPSAMQEP